MSLYKNLEALDAACKKYINRKDMVYKSPRHFRVSIGVSKYTLSNWKKTKPKYFNLIKEYEDQILAKLELLLIRQSFTKGRFNPAGVIFTLRAYDRDQYIPELAQTNTAAPEPYKITMKNTSGKKLDIIEVKPKEKEG